MKDKILGFVRTKTVYQTAVTTGTTIINGILGILFYIYLARSLGPAQFGIFSVAVLSLALIADIATVGTDTGIVKFVGKYLQSDKEKALRFLKLGLKTKIIVGTMLIIAGWFLVPFIAEKLLYKPELTVYLRYSLIGAFGGMIFTFTTSAIQAVQKFWAWGILNISLNALRLATILILAASLILNADLALVSYIVFPFIGFFAGLAILPGFLKVKNENSVSKEFFNYNKWVAVFTLIAAVSSRLDTYISARFLSLTEVGIYSVAVNLAGVVPQLVFAIAVVAAPKLSSFDTDAKAKAYLKKLQVLVLALGFAGLAVGIPLAYALIPGIYGSIYSPSIYPFIILLAAQAIFLISVPVHTAVIYYFGYPRLFVYISVVNLAAIAAGGYFLIGSYGMIGAAIAVLIGNTLNFIIPAVWVVRKFAKK